MAVVAMFKLIIVKFAVKLAVKFPRVETRQAAIFTRVVRHSAATSSPAQMTLE